jgi:hypothetical protein
MASITKIFKYIDDIRKYTPQIKSGSRPEDFEPFFRPQKQKIIKLIGQNTWTLIENYIIDQNLDEPGDVDEIKANAADLMSAALANLLAIPYFIFEASERNSTENKLYRYQENLQIDMYLEMAWNELNSLFDYLDTNTVTFTDYVDTDNYKLRSSMFLKNAADFTKYYGSVKSSYFFNNTLYIQEEELKERIMSRIPDYPTVPNTDTTWYIGKALTYLILSKACIQLDYTELPKSIRNDVTREVNTRKGHETDIKKTLSDAFMIDAEIFLRKIEFEINKSVNSGVYTAADNTLSERDKFYMP